MDEHKGGEVAAFEAYVEGLIGVIGHADRAEPLRDYCLGLMMPVARKSVEPLAAVAAPARVSAIPAGTNRTVTEEEMAAYTGPFPTPEARLPTWIFAREIRRSEDYLSEVEAGLARIADKPALIVWGDADGAFRAPDRDRFAQLFPNHRIVNLPGAKHFIQENAPEEIAWAVLDWQR